MDRILKMKSVIVCGVSLLSSYFGILSVPAMLMVICNVIDYITGIVAAKFRGNRIDSNKGFKGIWKKICMWFLVCVGIILDTLLAYAGQGAGIDIKVSFFVATVVCVWIICNELISILENISDTGVDLPPFLNPIIEQLKSKAESIDEINK